MDARKIVFFVLFAALVDINYAFPVAGCLEGWIYDNQTGSALEGVNVILADSSEAEVVISTVTTSPNGYFNICSVEPGIRHLLIWAPGFSPKRQIVQISDEQSLVFRLLKAGAINGIVVNASNQPIEGTRVNIEYLQKDDFALALNGFSGVFDSKNDGVFVVRNIEPSRPVRLTVTHPNYAPSVLSPIILESDQQITLRVVLTQ